MQQSMSFKYEPRLGTTAHFCEVVVLGRRCNHGASWTIISMASQTVPLNPQPSTLDPTPEGYQLISASGSHWSTQRSTRGNMAKSDHLSVGLSGRGTTRAEDAQGTPTQSHMSPSILVYEENSYVPTVLPAVVAMDHPLPGCLRNPVGVRCVVC